MSGEPHEEPPYQGGRKRHIVSRKEMDSRFYSDRVIAPLAAWVHQHKGALAEVAKRMSAYMGRSVSYQQVQRWLSMNPDTRTEPSFGAGMVMVRVIKTIRTEYQTGIAPPYTTGPLKVDPTSIKPDEGDIPESGPPAKEPADKSFTARYLRGRK